MAKDIKNKGKISKEDLAIWMEATNFGTVGGKEVTSDEELMKRLDRIGKREVTLEEVTRVAKTTSEAQLAQVSDAFNALFNITDILTIVMQDELNITEEQLQKASAKREEKMNSYIKEKQEELKKAIAEQSEKEEEVQEDSSEKVVQLKKPDLNG